MVPSSVCHWQRSCFLAAAAFSLPGTPTPWKPGVKSGDGEGVTCCLLLCSAGLFSPSRLKLPFPEGFKQGGESCSDADVPVQINQTGAEGAEEQDRELHLHCPLQADVSVLCLCSKGARS